MFNFSVCKFLEISLVGGVKRRTKCMLEGGTIIVPQLRRIVIIFFSQQIKNLKYEISFFFHVGIDSDTPSLSE